MSVKNAATGIVAALSVAALGLALFGYSPAPCACESMNSLLLASAGLLGPDHSAVHLDAAELEAGMDRSLRGSKIHGGDDSFYFSACVQLSATSVGCTLATERSMFLERGFKITFDTDTSGNFKKSHVSAYTDWP